MVRLGKSALADGALSPKAMRKGLEALLKMTTLARLKGAGEIVAVATSAVREAANGREFLAQVRALTGLDVRILSGEEEGALIFRAVQHAVDLSPRQRRARRRRRRLHRVVRGAARRPALGAERAAGLAALLGDARRAIRPACGRSSASVARCATAWRSSRLRRRPTA